MRTNLLFSEQDDYLTQLSDSLYAVPLPDATIASVAISFDSDTSDRLLVDVAINPRDPCMWEQWGYSERVQRFLMLQLRRLCRTHGVNANVQLVVH